MKRRNREQNLRLHGCDCDQARCYSTCPQYLTHFASKAEYWDWWGKTSPPDNRAREAIQQIEAPPAKKSQPKRKKRSRKKIIMYRPYYFGE
jgi:hypothetical protein